MKVSFQSVHGALVHGKVTRNGKVFNVRFLRDCVHKETGQLLEIWLVWVNGTLVDLSDLCCVIDAASDGIALGIACDLAVAKLDLFA